MMEFTAGCLQTSRERMLSNGNSLGAFGKSMRDGGRMTMRLPPQHATRDDELLCYFKFPCWESEYIFKKRSV